jgi:short-subunit dehydrogenase
MSEAGSGWKSVWITGASSGIGLELARLVGGRAEHLAVSARSESALHALTAENSSITAYPLDVADADAVAACVSAIEAAQGGIDLAVLNAGVWTLMDAAELDVEAVRKGVEVNFMGVMHAIDAVLPGMLERGSGHIAIVASVAGYRGLPKSIAYGPTKAALINLAETLRCELEPRGITVSVVNPGFVDTPMTRDNPFPMPAMISAEKAAGRFLDGLERRRYEIVFPRRFAWAMKALRLMPNAAYFWLVRNFVLKPDDQGLRSR